MIRITGRYKELIIGSGGENIAPVPIEEHIKSNFPAISNVVMVGDKRKYNVALVSLKSVGATGELPGTNMLDGAAKEVNPDVTKISEAQKDKIWLEYVEKARVHVNSDPEVCPNNAFKIQKMAILPRDFSVETLEFTPTLKMKRNVVEEVWKDVIDSMYD